jgi:PHD/YefM family antitoxin component YafN of YafNO toxin-antitoxin module
MAVTNISVLRKNLISSINNVIEYNDSITVSTKKGNVVIISEAEYNAMLETIYLVSQKGLVEKIKQGKKEDISKMSTYNPNEEW